MMYIVEVSSAGADIGAAMSRIRTWLDHNHCQPATLRQVTSQGARRILRFEFASERDAAAFAKSSAGRILRGRAGISSVHHALAKASGDRAA